MIFEFDDLPLWDHLRMHLLEGKHRAVTQPKLAEACGVSLRAVQDACEAAKARGEAVVTGGVGVWLTQDWRELQDAYRRDRRRGLKQLANNRGRLKAIARLQRAEQHAEQATLWAA